MLLLYPGTLPSTEDCPPESPLFPAKGGQGKLRRTRTTKTKLSRGEEAQRCQVSIQSSYHNLLENLRQIIHQRYRAIVSRLTPVAFILVKGDDPGIFKLAWEESGTQGMVEHDSKWTCDK